MTKEELEIELFRCGEENYTGNFVAAAVQIKDGYAYHAGLLICCEEGTFLFHFNALEIVLEEPPNDDWYFYKIFTFIDTRLVSAFLALCKNVQKESAPNFGTYYDGSYFDHSGIYFSKIVRSEYMTCVGFCVNVIKGFLSDEEEVEVFQFKDWTNADLSPSYLNTFVDKLKLQNPSADVNLLSDNVRRILPIEYIAAAYLKTMPFKRKNIATIVPSLELVIKERIPEISDSN